ncbi:unnamed protein product [Vitrella brassicaformis CCMP3155]|uniref:Uncharacterized protein n=1 Tax=Vitrella brassicaformis (strain CCMP3155) TaxID=1169540 RepID=A0A0G4EF91_VITBC|nr:unnamed protein product [Vitrella brassicaformis CCMP3155]|eukprot:CEL94641.1 unnamed protein product [Vitrella brassicaformis CCMP3155]
MDNRHVPTTGRPPVKKTSFSDLFKQLHGGQPASTNATPRPNFPVSSTRLAPSHGAQYRPKTPAIRPSHPAAPRGRPIAPPSAPPSFPPRAMPSPAPTNQGPASAGPANPNTTTTGNTSFSVLDGIFRHHQQQQQHPPTPVRPKTPRPPTGTQQSAAPPLDIGALIDQAPICPEGQMTAGWGAGERKAKGGKERAVPGGLLERLDKVHHGQSVDKTLAPKKVQEVLALMGTQGGGGGSDGYFEKDGYGFITRRQADFLSSHQNGGGSYLNKAIEVEGFELDAPGWAAPPHHPHHHGHGPSDAAQLHGRAWPLTSAAQAASSSSGHDGTYQVKVLLSLKSLRPLLRDEDFSTHGEQEEQAAAEAMADHPRRPRFIILVPTWLNDPTTQKQSDEANGEAAASSVAMCVAGVVLRVVEGDWDEGGHQYDPYMDDAGHTAGGYGWEGGAAAAPHST